MGIPPEDELVHSPACKEDHTVDELMRLHYMPPERRIRHFL